MRSSCTRDFGEEGSRRDRAGIARAITQPVLAVLGEDSDSRFHQRQKLLLEWLPTVEPFVLTDAGHLLHVENPGGLAEGLAGFFTRHPIGGAV